MGAGAARRGSLAACRRPTNTRATTPSSSAGPASPGSSSSASGPATGSSASPSCCSSWGSSPGSRQPITTVIVTSLIVGSLVLAPAIVFGYAVKAAERADQGLPDGH